MNEREHDGELADWAAKAAKARKSWTKDDRIEELEAEVERLRDLCLRAAGYIGVRQGPEVDEEADALLKELRGET